MPITTISELKKFKNWDVEYPNFYNIIASHKDLEDFVKHADKEVFLRVAFTKGVFPQSVVAQAFKKFLLDCPAPRTSSKSYRLVEYLHTDDTDKSESQLISIISEVLPYLYSRQHNGCSIDYDFALLVGIWSLYITEDVSGCIPMMLRSMRKDCVENIRKIILDSLS